MNAGSRPLFSDPANLFKINSFQASSPIWASEASGVSRYPPNGELVRRLTSELQFVHLTLLLCLLVSGATNTALIVGGYTVPKMFMLSN